MYKGIDIKARHEFYLSQDTQEPRTKFILRALSGWEMTELSSKDDYSINDLLNECVVSVEDGEFPDKESVLKSLDTGALGELITEINVINKVTEREAKN
jgi:hypothetical protein